LTAFPLAMPATVLLFGVSLGAIDALAPARAPADAAVRPTPRAARPGVVAAAGTLAVALVVAAGVLGYGVLASSYWRGRANAALAKDSPTNATTALALLDRAARAPRLDAVRFDLALRAAQVALRIDRGEVALQAADRALALEPHSPHAWAAHAAAKLALRDEAQAASDAARALTLFLDLPSARTTLDTIRRLEAIRRDAEPKVSRD
jgi:hypothetical protein